MSNITDFLDEMYKYSFDAGCFYTVSKDGLIKNDRSRLILGMIVGFDDDTDVSTFSKIEMDQSEVEKKLRRSYGAGANVQIENGELCIATTTSTHVYWHQDANDVYFSLNRALIEKRFGSKDNIDIQSVFLFVAQAYPPLFNRTFFKNISKVPGGYSIRINPDSCKLAPYASLNAHGVLGADKMKDPDSSFADAIEKEGQGYADLFNQSGITPVIGMSGVDSGSAYLSMSDKIETWTTHVNDYDFQVAHGQMLVTLLGDYGRTYSFMQRNVPSSEKLAELLSNDIESYFHIATAYETLNEITRDENKNFFFWNGNTVGLGQSFNSSLRQHSFYERHFFGATKRFYYTSFFMKNVKRFAPKSIKPVTNNKKGVVYNFLLSLAVPPSGAFFTFKPFAGLTDVTGLPRDMAVYALDALENVLNDVLDCVELIGDKVEEYEDTQVLRRVWDQLLCADQSHATGMAIYNHFGIFYNSAFNSTAAYRFLIDYKVPLWDCLYSKAPVYRYFRRKAGFSYQKLARIALKLNKIRGLEQPVTIMRALKKIKRLTIDRVWNKLQRFSIFRSKEKVNRFSHVVPKSYDGWDLYTKHNTVDLSLLNEGSAPCDYFKELANELEQTKEIRSWGPVERFLNISLYLSNCLKSN